MYHAQATLVFIPALPCTSLWKQIILQNLSYENMFDLHGNEPVDWRNNFLYKRLRTKTRFDTEAQGNTGMVI